MSRRAEEKTAEVLQESPGTTTGGARSQSREMTPPPAQRTQTPAFAATAAAAAPASLGSSVSPHIDSVFRVG